MSYRFLAKERKIIPQFETCSIAETFSETLAYRLIITGNVSKVILLTRWVYKGF